MLQLALPTVQYQLEALMSYVSSLEPCAPPVPTTRLSAMTKGTIARNRMSFTVRVLQVVSGKMVTVMTRNPRTIILGHTRPGVKYGKRPTQGLRAFATVHANRHGP